jgi:histidyl-tRNA synthetase
VAMNHGQLSYPFKRYQVQPVWRADKPQQSRYREFYQCDADVVGSHSLLNEVELANIYSTVFELLKIPVEIRINHRKILMALAEICGGDDKLTQITVAIDKLDKLGIEKVKEELAARDLNSSQVNAIEEYLSIAGTNETKLERISSLFHDNENGKKAIADIRFILDFAKNTVTGQGLTLDLTLARGLNYYTGTIFEIKVPNIQIGSIGGGGRYDDLTGLFGVPGVPGVGISFGVDRIYDTMEKLNLFPSEVSTGTQALFFNLGDKESRASFLLMQSLRKEGVRCELYHESSKFDKQFKYAEKKNIPYIIIVGEKELEENNCQVKNIITGKQETIAQKDLIRFTFTS